MEREVRAREEDSITPPYVPVGVPPPPIIRRKYRLFAENYEFLLEQMVCIACSAKPMMVPIRSCRRGHITCKTCADWMELCMHCFEEFTNVRNLNMENLVIMLCVPCRSGNRRCDARLPPKEMDEHMKVCKYADLECPLSMFKEVGCLWSGPRVQLYVHSFDHNFKILNTKRDFSYEDTSKCFKFFTHYVFLCVKKDLFVYYRGIHREQWFACIQSAGISNKSYVCRYELTGPNGIDKITITAPVTEIPEHVSHVVDYGKCLRLIDMVMENFMEYGSVKLKLHVYDVTKPRHPEYGQSIYS